jgi:CRISPR-associated Cas5-like protein
MSIRVEVWGDYACFSRPEMKVERVSYDVMTPSAARGLIDRAPRSVRLSGGGAKGRQSGLPCGGPFRPGGRRHPRSLAEPL